MRVIKISLVLALVLISTSLYAAPKKADADKWLADFRVAKDKTTDGIFLKKQGKSDQHAELLRLLEKRSRQLFGDVYDEPYGVCTGAAISLQYLWADQLLSLSDPSNINIAGQSSLAWEGGMKYWSCRLAIESTK